MKKFSNKITVLSFLAVLSLAYLVSFDVALGQVDILTNTLDQTTGNAGLPTGAASANLPARIGTAINVFFGIIGVMFLGMSVLGGILWMIAGGNEEKVTRAKKFITGGSEGLLVIFLSYAMVYLVLAALQYAAS